MKHLHILARLATGDVTGRLDRLTPERAMFTLEQNGYPSGDQLAAVITGKLERGYHVEPGRWVAVMSCDGATDDECVELAASVAIGGDIQMGRVMGVL